MLGYTDGWQKPSNSSNTKMLPLAKINQTLDLPSQVES
jgi:hypothetical protein